MRCDDCHRTLTPEEQDEQERGIPVPLCIVCTHRLAYELGTVIGGSVERVRRELTAPEIQA